MNLRQYSIPTLWLFLVLCACTSPMFAQNIILKLRPNARIQSIESGTFSAPKPVLSQFFSQNNERIFSANPALEQLKRYYILTPNTDSSPERILAELRRNSAVEYADFNRKWTIGETISVKELGKSAEKTSHDIQQEFENWGLAKVGAESAWKIATGKGVIVGIIDTGIDFFHPALQSRLWINPKEDRNGNGTFEPWSDTVQVQGIYGDLDGIDNDGDGFTDDVIGYDFVDQSLANAGDYANRDAIPYDENGHGTNVASVIGGARESRTPGLAYDANIMVLRAFDAGGNAEEDDIASAIVFGVLHGARVLNMSYGDVFYSPLVADALNFAAESGVFLVASSGNNGGTKRHFPSDYNDVLSVGASTQNDNLWFRSGYGSMLDILAPGVNIAVSAPDSSVIIASGTSFSAPFVSAAAALLLEKNPLLKPEEIRGILSATADKLSDSGWTSTSGAGRLNAANALHALGATVVRIASPVNEMLFNKRNIREIPVIGSALTPLFAEFSIAIGKGEEPTEWTELAKERVQKNNDTLGFIPIFSLADTVYTLRLAVKQTSGIALMRHSRFQVFSSPLKISDVSSISAWKNGKRVVVISAKTDRISDFSVRFRKKNSADSFTEIADLKQFTKNHTVTIGFEVSADEENEAEIIAVSGNDTARFPFTFRRSSEAFPEYTFQPKFMPAEGSEYLLNRVTDFYGDGNPAFAYFDPISGSTRLSQFISGEFLLKDSLSGAGIPQGIGDSNGDGIPELWTQWNGKSTLFQPKTRGGFPFIPIFSVNGSALTMADLNNDGKEELIVRTDSSVVAYTFNGTTYSQLAAFTNNSPTASGANRNTFGPLVCAVGDFDGDGNIELCFGDSDGDFSVIEYSNGAFRREFLDTNDVADINAYVCAGDIDGDGKPEILMGFHSQLSWNAEREYDTPLWSFKILQSVGKDTYSVIWRDSVYGVRQPSLFKSGLSAGDLNGLKGDEIVISTFPDLYVLTWDSAEKRMIPLWHSPSALANSAMIADFDKDKKNELCFFNGRALQAYQCTRAPNRAQAPTGLQAVALGENSARVSWNSSPNAKEYTLWQIKFNKNGSGLGFPRMTTTATEILADSLENLTWYGFQVVSRNNTLPDTLGEVSERVYIFTHPPVEPQAVSVRSPRILQVDFSGFISEKSMQPSIFAVNTWGSPSAAVYAGEKSALLTFPFDLPPGQYELSVRECSDYFDSPTKPKTLRFTVPNTPQNVELFLTKLTRISEQELELSFSEPADSASATQAKNYDFQPTGIVSSVDWSPKSVRLHVEGVRIAPIGKTYVVTAKNIRATSGNPMTLGAGNTLGLTLSADDITSAYVYPNPAILAQTEEITFAELPRNAELTITSIEGETLATLVEKDGNGGISWNIRNQKGERLASGVYLFRVKFRSATGEIIEAEPKKFVIIR